VFFCCNQREPGAACCNNHHAQENARLRQGSRQVAATCWPGKGAGESGGLHGPLRRGPGDRDLSSGDLVTPTWTRATSMRSSTIWSTPASSSAAHLKSATQSRLSIDGPAGRSRSSGRRSGEARRGVAGGASASACTGGTSKTKLCNAGESVRRVRGTARCDEFPRVEPATRVRRGPRRNRGFPGSRSMRAHVWRGRTGGCGFVGAFVAASVAGRPAETSGAGGARGGRFPVGTVPAERWCGHGEEDYVVQLKDALDWGPTATASDRGFSRRRSFFPRKLVTLQKLVDSTAAPDWRCHTR